MKSDWSVDHPPNFSNEPGPPHTEYVNPPTQYTQHYDMTTHAKFHLQVNETQDNIITSWSPCPVLIDYSYYVCRLSLLCCTNHNVVFSGEAQLLLHI